MIKTFSIEEIAGSPPDVVVFVGTWATGKERWRAVYELKHKWEINNE